MSGRVSGRSLSMPDQTPILTDAALKRIAGMPIEGEHSLMAREIIAWRRYGADGHKDQCPMWGGASDTYRHCTCGLADLEPFLRD